MTNAELIQDRHANVHAWADMNHDDPMIGWDLDLTDLVIDNVDAERDDLVDQVRDFLDNLADSPEMYGITFPIYTADIFDIYDRNTSEVEDALHEMGGLTDLGSWSSDTTIGDLIHTAVACYVDSVARQAANELLGALDLLEEMLEGR